ncbi:MAG: hypothetical protein PWP46_263 [Fusobacteriaceae bacterium]|jgi:hypothetical protein|nr:hypothetical protein [Fusobacteriaceae bacterium]
MRKIDFGLIFKNSEIISKIFIKQEKILFKQQENIKANIEKTKKIKEEEVNRVEEIKLHKIKGGINRNRQKTNKKRYRDNNNGRWIDFEG